MTEEKCVFCDFDRRFVIDESEHAFAAYFDCAIRPGHIVVALKQHAESLSRLAAEQAADLMSLAAAVAKRAEPLVGCEKFYLVSIADETPHYHVHLLPKMPGAPPIGRHIMGADGWRGEVGAPVDADELSRFAEKYRAERETPKQS